MMALVELDALKKAQVRTLMLQAAEVSKGRTVNQLMAYSQPQSNHQEGSTKRQMYMVNAPLTGYMKESSARACIMRYNRDPLLQPYKEISANHEAFPGRDSNLSSAHHLHIRFDHQ